MPIHLGMDTIKITAEVNVGWAGERETQTFELHPGYGKVQSKVSGNGYITEAGRDLPEGDSFTRTGVLAVNVTGGVESRLGVYDDAEDFERFLTTQLRATDITRS